MKQTIFAIKAIWKLFLTAIYAMYSFDASIMLELSNLAKRPFWKKFWQIDSKMEMAIAEGIRNFC